MSRFIKIFCVFMLITMLLPRIFGFASIPLQTKLQYAAQITSKYSPPPEFPSFPEFTRYKWYEIPLYFVDGTDYFFQFYDWCSDLLKWFLDDIVITVRLVRLFILNSK